MKTRMFMSFIFETLFVILVPGTQRVYNKYF